MERASEADCGFLFEVSFFYMNLLHLPWAFLRCGGCCPFLYPDVVILDAKQLMWLFKKNSRLCEDCLLHCWYYWNSSFVSLTGRIIFLRPWYEVKSLNRFRTVSPLLITIERKTAKREKILVWRLCGRQRSFREKELGEIISQLHFQGLG